VSFQVPVADVALVAATCESCRGSEPGEPLEADDGKSTAYLVSDHLATFTVRFSSHKIEVKIENRSSSPLRIDWDASGFVEPSGEASGVVPAGRMTLFGSDEAGFDIPPGAYRAIDVAKASGSPIGTSPPLFHLNPAQGERSRERARHLVGKTVQLILALEHQDELRRYTFEGLVQGFRVGNEWITPEARDPR
jgi:hypothetical protein